MGLYEVIQVKRNGRYDVKNAADFEDPLQTSTSADFMKLRRYASKEEEDENLSSEEEEASVTDVLQDGRKWAGGLDIGGDSLSRCVRKWYSTVHHHQPNQDTEGAPQ